MIKSTFLESYGDGIGAGGEGDDNNDVKWVPSPNEHEVVLEQLALAIQPASGVFGDLESKRASLDYAVEALQMETLLLQVQAPSGFATSVQGIAFGLKTGDLRDFFSQAGTADRTAYGRGAGVMSPKDFAK
jgi:hypothetical protein